MEYILKQCIGRLSCHERSNEDISINSPDIRGVGWLIDPSYQGNGYGKEAGLAMIDYMFKECEIEAIITGAAIVNPASWRIMEYLGFTRINKTRMVQYTFLDEPVEIYEYLLIREEYLKTNNQKSTTKK